MLDHALWLIGNSFFPHVEDPLPERIGLGLPFATAGFGGVLADVIFGGGPDDRRDRMTRWGLRGGFGLGCVFYLVSLAVQLR